jgi:N-acyl-L-homoserine lactone synthetase
LKNEKLNEKHTEAYSLHARKLQKYKRLKINVNKHNKQWSIDLADLKELSGYNSQYRYLLVCVDVYSRYAFIKLLKTKSARNVANKFEQILIEEKEIPEKIQSDEGTEFAIIKHELAAKYNFKLFHTFNRETEAVHAERFIQTIKQMIHRTLTHFHSYNYTKYLPIIVERYNEAPHSRLFGKSPKDIYIKRKNLMKLSSKLIKIYYTLETESVYHE